MPSGEFHNVYNRILGDPNFYAQLVDAPSPEARVQLLEQAGLNPNVNFNDLVQDVEQTLRSHPRGGGAAAPGGAGAPAGPAAPEAVEPERAVEWVAAAAAIVAAWIIT